MTEAVLQITIYSSIPVPDTSRRLSKNNLTLDASLHRVFPYFFPTAKIKAVYYYDAECNINETIYDVCVHKLLHRLCSVGCSAIQQRLQVRISIIQSDSHSPT